ncbi:TPA: excisionase [Escherichia coli]
MVIDLSELLRGQSQILNKRVQRGVWREGVQVLKVEGVKERWIDLSEVAKWARQNCSNYRAA